jgi:hypothetical protein
MASKQASETPVYANQSPRYIMLKQRVKELTLSNPAMFLFSAKNSAGDSAAKKKGPRKD